MYRFIFAALLTLSSAATHATQCAEKSFEAQEKAASVIFEGEVIGLAGIREDRNRDACWQSSKDGSGCGGKIATFEISIVWKGDVAKTSTVSTEDACLCSGQGFEKGKQYVVFANPDLGRTGADYRATDACGGTAQIKKGAGGPADGALRKLFKPRSPSRNGKVEQGSEAGRSLTGDDANAALVAGAHKTGIQDLLGLIPPMPPGAHVCSRCNGTRLAAPLDQSGRPVKGFGEYRRETCGSCGWVAP